MRIPALIFLLLLSQDLKSQNLNNDLQEVFDDFQLMGMSVWTACGDQEEQYHFGLRDLTRDLPMNEASMYRIASISKSFTALGLLKLHDEGLFELDDDISDCMGYPVINPQFPETPITFRMLLSHTSSLQDGTGYNDFLGATYNAIPVISIAEVLVPGGDHFTANMWRTEPPGTHFAYSNINFGLIGTLIEKISGERFDLYMKSEILEPLGISGSYNVNLIDDIDDVAVIYRNISGWTPQVDNYQGEYPTAPNLEGGPSAMTSDSNCFDESTSPGCEDPDCQTAVCAEDEWCCSNEWDDLCVAAALEICEGATSNCLSANGGMGCDNNECQTTVCATLPDCCDVEWDSECANLALENCGPPAYEPGTNGAYFAPQGGLRASAQDVGKLLRFLKTGGATVPGLIGEETLAEMTAVAWDYEGNNGDNYFGLFNRWGLGVHHANTEPNDQICLNEGWGSFIGHPGEAYGLVSDAYYSENGEVSFVFMHNGIGVGYEFGEQSIYYLVEEAVFAALCDHFAGCFATSTNEPERQEVEVFPNPFSDRAVMNIPDHLVHQALELRVFDLTGKMVWKENINTDRFLIEASVIGRGAFVYSLVNESGELVATEKLLIAGR